jgi:hypothetical protein
MNQRLQHFVGKICSVFTCPVNRQLDQSEIHTYFLGVVEAVDEKGILLNQIGTYQKSYFFFPNIVGIAEEKVLDANQDAELIAKLKENAQQDSTPRRSENSRFIDPAALAKMAREIQGVPSKDPLPVGISSP